MTNQKLENLKKEFTSINRTIENLKLDGVSTNDQRILKLEKELDSIMEEVKKINN